MPTTLTVPPKPQTIDEYTDWLVRSRIISQSDLTQATHVQAAQLITDEVLDSATWLSVQAKLPTWRDAYQAEADSTLLAFEPQELVAKSFASTLEKAFRRDILLNCRWPNKPTDELDWTKPDNWWSNLNDLIRTQWIVKFLDGVTFLSNALVTLFDSLGVPSRTELKATDWGYYAAHVYFSAPLDIRHLPNVERVTVEIQITTQLQEVIGPITHREYERRRLTIPPPDLKWQWQYDNPEFSTHYLGHILHYLEGVIVRARKEGSASIAATS